MNREPWEMTIKDYVESQPTPEDFMEMNKLRYKQFAEHKASVEQALSEGKPVPATYR